MKPDWFTKALLIAVLIAQLFILLRPHPTPTLAQEEPKNQPPAPSTNAPKFDHLRFFTYSNGATGVFDTTDGMLYLYDTNLLNAPIARQLVKPGEPMKRVKG